MCVANSRNLFPTSLCRKRTVCVLCYGKSGDKLTSKKKFHSNHFIASAYTLRSVLPSLGNTTITCRRICRMSVWRSPCVLSFSKLTTQTNRLYMYVVYATPTNASEDHTMLYLYSVDLILILVAV